MSEEEIEINFRLDANGRTASTKNNDQKEQDSNDNGTSKKAFEMQYKPAAVMGQLCFTEGTKVGQVDQSSSLLDELLYDCEITDCGLMPRTFWVPFQGFQPRCSLEQMALDVFKFHTGDADYDPETSGAEWWVQIRPSPEKTGRYSMHDKSDDPDDMAKEGISFHWDKDEDLRLLCGGNTYIHPHISTVSYLTDLGAPTVAFNIRVNNMTGEYITQPKQSTAAEKDSDEKNKGGIIEGFLSWPKFCKHMSFDGRYLHAAPADIMEKGAFQKQIQIPEKESLSKEELTKIQRRKRRVTFLVNVWLNYKPFGVKPFPESMVDKLSGHREGQAKLNLKLQRESQNGNGAENIAIVKDVEIIGDKARDKISQKDVSLEDFEWPLGDCGSEESIEVKVPVGVIREEASKGGSLRLSWAENGGQHGLRLRLQKSADEPSLSSQELLEAETETDTRADSAERTKRPRLE